MFGAIIGDIVGSEYEFHNTNNYKFKMFGPSATFTDDTVCTVAVASALLRYGKKLNKPKMAETFHEICEMYPYAGYGARFFDWLKNREMKPYQSCGNGSAMRISPVGWFANSKEEVKKYCNIVTKVTHNHPEGVKGAYVCAMCIYLLRNKATKEDIKKFASKYYNLNYTLKPTLKHGLEICQVTVPDAIKCFLESKSFEDCLRKAVSLGGDSDTLADIACSIAEPFYGIPKKFKELAFNKIDSIISDVLIEFTEKYCC